jgi:MATE family multidrug resistance protein
MRNNLNANKRNKSSKARIKTLKDDALSIFSLALPLIATQCIQSVTLLVNTFLMGQLGPKALAGGALALSAFYMCYILAFGMVSATGNLVAISYGAGRHQEVISTVRSGLLLSLLISLGMGILLWHSTPLMLALGQDREIIEVAQRFLRILIWGIPFNLWFLTLRSFSAGLGKTRAILWLMLSSLLFSGGLGWLLSKSYGVYGIAMVSTFTYVYMSITFTCLIHFHPTYKRYPVFFNFSLSDVAILPSLLRIGSAWAGTLCLETSMLNICAWLIGALGAEALAAHQSVMQLVITSFAVPNGLMYAVSILVGQAAGTENWYKVRSLLWTGGSILLSLSLSIIIILLLLSNQLLSLFFPDEIVSTNEARNIAMKLMPLAALLCLLDGWQTFISGILRALQDAKITMLIHGISYWIVGIPIAWFLSEQGCGPIGIWWGMCIGFAIACVILQIRLGVCLHTLINGSVKLMD